MAFDFLSAVTGADLALSFALVLMIIYFLWFFSWGKKQVGSKLGLLIAIVLMYLTFYLYPDLIWIPFILFILATFGKELLERIPRPQ
jgi:uncharacterized membrane protein